MSASTDFCRSFVLAASPIIQTSFASSAKSASLHPLDRLRDAELLERQAHGDQHLVHLLVGDAEHDGAAIRVRDDESLVLELPQRLAHRAAARLQLARDLVLDQALAVLELPGDDRLAQRLDHLLAAGAALGLIRYC